MSNQGTGLLVSAINNKPITAGPPDTFDANGLRNQLRQELGTYNITNQAILQSLDNYIDSQVQEATFTSVVEKESRVDKIKRISSGLGIASIGPIIGAAARAGALPFVAANPIGAAAAAAFGGGMSAALRNFIEVKLAANKGEQGLIKFYSRNLDIDRKFSTTQSKDRAKAKRLFATYSNLGKNEALESTFGIEEREDELFSTLQSLGINWGTNWDIENPTVVAPALENMPQAQLQDLMTKVAVLRKFYMYIRTRADFAKYGKDVMIMNAIETFSRLLLVAGGIMGYKFPGVPAFEIAMNQSEREIEAMGSNNKGIIKSSIRMGGAQALKSFGSALGVYGITAGIQRLAYFLPGNGPALQVNGINGGVALTPEQIHANEVVANHQNAFVDLTKQADGVVTNLKGGIATVNNGLTAVVGELRPDQVWPSDPLVGLARYAAKVLGVPFKDNMTHQELLNMISGYAKLGGDARLENLKVLELLSNNSNLRTEYLRVAKEWAAAHVGVMKEEEASLAIRGMLETYFHGQGQVTPEGLLGYLNTGVKSLNVEQMKHGLHVMTIGGDNGGVNENWKNALLGILKMPNNAVRGAVTQVAEYVATNTDMGNVEAGFTKLFAEFNSPAYQEAFRIHLTTLQNTGQLSAKLNINQLLKDILALGTEPAKFIEALALFGINAPGQIENKLNKSRTLNIVPLGGAITQRRNPLNPIQPPTPTVAPTVPVAPVQGVNPAVIPQAPVQPSTALITGATTFNPVIGRLGTDTALLSTTNPGESTRNVSSIIDDTVLSRPVDNTIENKVPIWQTLGRSSIQEVLARDINSIRTIDLTNNRDGLPENFPEVVISPDGKLQKRRLVNRLERPIIDLFVLDKKFDKLNNEVKARDIGSNVILILYKRDYYRVDRKKNDKPNFVIRKMGLDESININDLDVYPHEDENDGELYFDTVPRAIDLNLDSRKIDNTLESESIDIGVEPENGESLQDRLERELKEELELDGESYIYSLDLSTTTSLSNGITVKSTHVVGEDGKPVKDVIIITVGDDSYFVDRRSEKVSIKNITDNNHPEVTSKEMFDGKDIRLEFNENEINFIGTEKVESEIPKVEKRKQQTTFDGAVNAKDRIRLLEDGHPNASLVVTNRKENAIAIQVEGTPMLPDEKYLLMGRLSLWYDLLAKYDKRIITDDELKDFDFEVNNNGTNIRDALGQAFNKQGEGLNLFDFLSNPEKFNFNEVYNYLKETYNWGGDEGLDRRAILVYIYHLIHAIEINLDSHESVYNTLNGIRNKNVDFKIAEELPTRIEDAVIIGSSFDESTYSAQQAQFILGRTTILYKTADQIYPKVEDLIGKDDAELREAYPRMLKIVIQLILSKINKNIIRDKELEDQTLSQQISLFGFIDGFDDINFQRELAQYLNTDENKKAIALILYSISLSLESQLMDVDFTSETPIDPEIKDAITIIEERSNRSNPNETGLALSGANKETMPFNVRQLSVIILNTSNIVWDNLGNSPDPKTIKTLAIETVLNRIRDLDALLNEITAELDRPRDPVLERFILELLLRDFITPDLVVLNEKDSYRVSETREVGAIDVKQGLEELRNEIGKIQTEFEAEQSKTEQKKENPTSIELGVEQEHEYTIEGGKDTGYTIDVMEKDIIIGKIQILAGEDNIRVAINASVEEKEDITKARLVFSEYSPLNNTNTLRSHSLMLSTTLVERELNEQDATKIKKAKFKFKVSDLNSEDTPIQAMPPVQDPLYEDTPPNGTKPIDISEVLAKEEPGLGLDIDATKRGDTRPISRPNDETKENQAPEGIIEPNFSYDDTQTLNDTEVIESLDLNREPSIFGGNIPFDQRNNANDFASFFLDINKINDVEILESMLENSNNNDQFDRVIERLLQIPLNQETAYAFLLLFLSKNSTNNRDINSITTMGKLAGFQKDGINRIMFIKQNVNKLITKVFQEMHIPSTGNYRDILLERLYDISISYQSHPKEKVEPLLFDNEKQWRDWDALYMDIMNIVLIRSNPKISATIKNFFEGFLTKSKKELIDLLKQRPFDRLIIKENRFQSQIIDEILQVFGEEGLNWITRKELGIVI